MNKKIVFINEREVTAMNFNQEMTEGDRKIVSFDFKVKSEESHDVTTLLYKNNFIICVPEQELEFPATIKKYYTSITDLYKGNAVADFHLELMESD